MTEIDRDRPLHAGRDGSILGMGPRLRAWPICSRAHHPRDDVQAVIERVGTRFDPGRLRKHSNPAQEMRSDDSI
ncbi:hypothetical protein [Falsiroseomonas stagni]|uniref:hypothetical protein n=1 Tax=Falsiroseomonas stagni TaxID=484882 RepID=UPI000B81D1B3|nr:hypothetical protein [Falsiroseomonas stagni]